jgi:hypothetical protein
MNGMNSFVFVLERPHYVVTGCGIDVVILLILKRLCSLKLFPK